MDLCKHAFSRTYCHDSSEKIMTLKHRCNPAAVLLIVLARSVRWRRTSSRTTRLPRCQPKGHGAAVLCFAGSGHQGAG